MGRSVDENSVIKIVAYECGEFVGLAKEIEKQIKALPSEQPTIEERKAGYWKKVPGYATPGGDPVWACSECGKGIHVYGIEHRSYGNDIADGQWVACPNCGVEMLGGEQWES